MPVTVNWRPRVPAFPGADQNVSLARKLQHYNRSGVTVQKAESSLLKAELRISARARALLVFDVFYFPGWEATVDGRASRVYPDASGRLTVEVPEGEHRVIVRFSRTYVRALADCLSALGVLGCIVMLWLGRFRAPNAERVPRHFPPGA